MIFMSLVRSLHIFVKSLIFPVTAIILALLYIFALHPVTGYMGGFVYLALGWLIPSLINLIISAWVVLFFKFHWSFRLVIFVAVSFLLGVNNLFPMLFKAYPEPVSSSEIARVIRITPDMDVDEGLMTPRISGESDQTQAPSALGVSVGSNEGCMCMWFTHASGPSTEQEVWGVINAKVGRSGIHGPVYIGSHNMALGKAHFDVRFFRSKTSAKTVDLLITVYDGWDVTATFRQADIPISGEISKGNAPGLKVDRFYENALSMLLRHNFWVFMLDARMSGFSREPLRRFLDRAVVVQ